jgi:hypothetical protein
MWMLANAVSRLMTLKADMKGNKICSMQEHAYLGWENGLGL